MSRKFISADFANRFPLTWSHYVLLVRRTRTSEARAFYEAEALRGGWSVRQLERQISTHPPVGLILCAQKDYAVAHYALEGLPNKVLAAEYRTALPDEKTLVAEIEKTRKMLEIGMILRGK